MNHDVCEFNLDFAADGSVRGNGVDDVGEGVGLEARRVPHIVPPMTGLLQGFLRCILSLWGLESWRLLSRMTELSQPERSQ